jgi:hypothetical protein
VEGGWSNPAAFLVHPDYRRVVRLKPREGRGNNRSVMPFDVLGRTRATLVGAESGIGGARAIARRGPGSRGLGNLGKPYRAWARSL